MSSPDTPVAIVGAGYSGAILAAQLARRGVRCLLIEGSGRAGLGAAYSTSDPVHLLNVRAEAMSAWAAAPADFAQFWEEQGGSARDFAERRAYGRYLRGILDDALGSGRVSLVEASAVGAARGGEGWSLQLHDGTSVAARHLVLATGNEPPARQPWAEAAGDRLVANPWSAAARESVAAAAAEGADVLILGTGLTMIDVVLSLDAAGHKGSVLAMSRRGLIPRPHSDAAPAQVDGGALPTGLLDLWRWLRRRSSEVDWRSAVDSLRPHSHRLWQGLSLDDKRRFLRHARPWWDVHRHRIAPQVSARVHELIGEGRLQVAAGRLLEVRGGSDGVEIRSRLRGEGDDAARWRRFHYLFDCTGPLGFASSRNPLLRQLLQTGMLAPDELGIGAASEADGRAAGHRDLWLVGPLTKGRYWEMVAVPDIRVQADQVATAIAGELQQR